MDLEKIDLVVIHCTDSPDTADFHFEDINNWHKERGFPPYIDPKTDLHVYCGYHLIVNRQGIVEMGRPDHIIGCHARGFNKRSIGIVWVGRDRMRATQADSLIRATAHICQKYDLTVENIKGHHELNPQKTCPNFKEGNLFVSMDDFRKRYVDYILQGVYDGNDARETH